MKKLFENPEINVAELAQEDVMAVSADLAERRSLKVVDNTGWNGDNLGSIWQGGDWI